MKPKTHSRFAHAGFRWLGIAMIALAPHSRCWAIEPPGETAPRQPEEDQGWPREFTLKKARLTCYQPQIDEWENYKVLHARLAVSLTPAGEAPCLGVAEITGQTTTDQDTRTVLIRNITVNAARFQTEKPEDAARLEALLKEVFPKTPVSASLDRILAGVKLSKGSARTVELKMDPPPIFVSTSASMLLMVEGKPVLAPIDKVPLKFVVNTNWDILFDEAAGNYYLLSGDEWLTAKEPDGPWILAESLPAAVNELPDDETWQHVKQDLPWRIKKGMIVPKVFFSDKPAEMISFSGDPVWQKIEGTNLSWATNTDSHVFQTGEGTIYFLTSGRWFKTPKLGEAWTYGGNDLPEDFGKLPEDASYSEVLASVPGTEEAEDAVILASVPVEAVVKIKEAEAKAKATYNGDPEFKPVDGTGLQYATNTPDDVIGCEGKYYLCQDAVWFVSDAATGPWKICKDVPDAIYKIPPSSPVYRVTYVNVEDDADDDDGEVTTSYTAGYFGSFIAGLALGECLWWGTGWYYPPYVGWWGRYPAYYPYHYSYGCAAVYNRWTGGYAVGERFYGPYASAGRAAWYNPATGRYGRAAHVEGPWGGRTVAGAYNPRTGTGWATRQGNNGYAQWGTSVARRGDNWVRTAHVAGPDGGVAGWRGSNGAGTFHWSDQGHGGMAVHNGDFYAGHDGNVYRKDDGQWSKWENGGWQPAGHNADGIRPDHGKNGFISGQTDHFPGYPQDRTRPGEGGAGTRNPALDHRPGEGGAGTRNPALDHRLGEGGAGTRNPNLPQRHVTDPGEVQNRLNREAHTRDRGEQRTQQYRQQRSNWGSGGGGFNRGGGGFQRGGFGGGGGFHRGGGGGFRRR